MVVMARVKKYVLHLAYTLLGAAFLVLQKYWNISGSAFLILVLLRYLYGGTLTLILLISTSIGLAYNVTDYLVYQPDTPNTSRMYVELPRQNGTPHENIFITTKDNVKINLLLLKQPESAVSRAPTILYLHGNAGNIGHRLQSARDLYEHLSCNVALLEWRGYGKSEGTPSEEGLYADALSALEYLTAGGPGGRSDVDPGKVVVFGRSLGGAVAIHLAAALGQGLGQGHVAALVVENTFTSIKGMGGHLLPVLPLHLLPDLMLKNKFSSISKITKIPPSVPILFISGSEDNIIPPVMMKELFNKCVSLEKKMVIFESGGHNDVWLQPGYCDKISYFIHKVLRIDATHGDSHINGL